MTALLIVLTGTLSYFLLRPDGTYPQIRYPGEPGDGFGIADVYRGDRLPKTFGAVPLCQTGNGLTITSLEPVGGIGGLRVVDFAVRPWNGSGFGAGQVSLAKAGFTTERTVRAACRRSDELGITVQRTASGNGQWARLRVHYNSNGKERTAIIPFQLKLCGPGRTTMDACGPPDTP